MDPNFIHMDWERTFEALVLVAVFAIIIERALSVVFQNRIYIERVHRDGLKESIAIAVSIAVCVVWKLDAMSMIVLKGTTTVPGYIVTGALVAGGSKGSLKLFQDFFGLQSSAFKMRYALQAAKAAEEAKLALSEAKAAPTKAAAEFAGAKAAAAVKKVKDAVVKAQVEGTSVPGETVKAAESALKEANDEIKNKAD